MSNIDCNQLREILEYQPETGLFFWKKKRNGISVGQLAGGKDRDGYIRIRIDNVKYAAHRLAWMYIHNDFPKNFIDHINGIKSDNRICNLKLYEHYRSPVEKLTDKEMQRYRGNELAMIFNLIGIDTNEVLKAARTKWNFLDFKPGLVGGHCIGVDPYYLAQKAQEYGYHPEIILAGRRVNDGMGKYIANQVIKMMVKKSITIKKSKILILGFTFKENCPDVRNTKIIDIVNEFEDIDANIVIYDPWANPIDVKKQYNRISINKLKNTHINFDVIILCVSHNEFKKINLNKITSKNSIIYDIKGFYSNKVVDSFL